MSERSGILDRERERLQAQTKVVSLLVKEQLGSLNIVLNDLRDSGHAKNQGMETNHRLKTLTEALTGVRTLAIFDKNGTIVYSSRPELIGQNFSAREYFQAIRQSPSQERLYVSAPFLTTLGVYTLTLTKMIAGEDGGFAGIVLATLDPSFFEPLLNSVLYTPDMWAMLVHGGGKVFLMAPHRENLAGTDLAVPGSLFTRHMDSGKQENTYTGRVYITGEERMLATRTIRLPELHMDHPLVLGIARDVNQTLSAWLGRVLEQASLFLVASLLSIMALAYYQKIRRAALAKLAEADRAIEESSRFVRMITDNVPGMVGYWDRDLRNVYANKAYLEWFGKTQEQMQGINIRELLGGGLYQKNEQHILAALRGEPQQFVRDIVKPDGSHGYTLARYIPDADGERIKGFFVLVSDVTELKKTQLELEDKVKELAHMAVTDPLTGLPNRRSFLGKAEEELDRARRYKTAQVFLMMDIDHFKAINDTYGHAAGDEVLKALAGIIRQTLRSTDIYGRLGGEEFGAIICRTDLEQARIIAEKLRDRVQQSPVTTSAGVVGYTVSIGVAPCEYGDCSIETGMQEADKALYDAKNTGRNKVSAFSRGIAATPG